MTFTDYYKNLPESRTVAPKTAFVKKIAELCMVSEQTVRMWIQGVQKPDALKRSIIAQEMMLTEAELFPQSEN